MSTPADDTACSVSLNIDELLKQASVDWAAHITECHDYAQTQQIEYQKARALADEFALYADALTHIVHPFTFSKKRAKAFTDDGHNGSYYGGEHWDYCANGCWTNVGTVDYWAAALVDAEFMDLCRQRIRLRDDRYGKDYARDTQSHSTEFNLFTDKKDISEVRHRWDDGGRGFFDRWDFLSFDSPVDYDKWTNRDIGAYYRLTRQMHRKFKRVMKDPAKAAAVDKIRQFFYETFKENYHGKINKPYEAESILNNDPVKNKSAMTALHKAAYLKFLGYAQLEFIEQRTADGGVYTLAEKEKADIAISVAIHKSTYADGRPAPSLDSYDGRNAFSQALDRIIYEELGNERLDKGVDPYKAVEGLRDHRYSLTHSQEGVALSQEFGRKFLVEVKNYAYI